MMEIMQEVGNWGSVLKAYRSEMCKKAEKKESTEELEELMEFIEDEIWIYPDLEAEEIWRVVKGYKHIAPKLARKVKEFLEIAYIIELK